MKNLFLITTVFVGLLSLTACQSNGMSAEEKLRAYDARIADFEKNGKVVSQKKGVLITPGEPLSIEEAKQKVKEKCLLETSVKSSCDNLEVIDNSNGTVTIQYIVK